MRLRLPAWNCSQSLPI